VALARSEVVAPRFQEMVVEFAGAAGRQRKSLLECRAVAFEDVEPVRRFRWSKGRREFAGWWWSATTGRHVGYESWLERDHVMLLDFDQDVVGVASQPFWLRWWDGTRSRRHAPDYFVRRVDGTGVVIDVRADERVDVADEEVFAATARACAEVGWSFRRVGVPPVVLLSNVRWLSRYRHPRCGRDVELADRLGEACQRPRPLFEAVAEAGDRLAVLPVLFHLLWWQVLRVDLAVELLHPGSLVSAAGRGRARQ
jgi:hypothetical protein